MGVFGRRKLGGAALLLSALCLFCSIAAGQAGKLDTSNLSAGNDTADNSTIDYGNGTTLPQSEATSQETTGSPSPTTSKQATGTSGDFSPSANNTLTPPDMTSEGPARNETTFAPKKLPCRSFDTASFVGGITLGLALCALGYLLYKCYMARRRGGRAPYNQF